MLTFEKIKYFYDKKLWTEEMVKDAVKMNKITMDEFYRIVDPYNMNRKEEII